MRTVFWFQRQTVAEGGRTRSWGRTADGSAGGGACAKRWAAGIVAQAPANDAFANAELLLGRAGLIRGSTWRLRGSHSNLLTTAIPQALRPRANPGRGIR